MSFLKNRFFSTLLVPLMIGIVMVGCINPPVVQAPEVTEPVSAPALSDLLEELGPLEGTTPLIQAIKHGRPDIVQALVEDGQFDIDERDDDRKTALIWAAVLGNARLEELKLLLEEGADVNAYDNDGLTALMLTALRGEIEATEALLDAEGLDVNVQDNDGLTALMHAASGAPQRGYEVLELILEVEDLDINATDDSGQTALAQAVSRNDIEAVRLLLDKGADANLDVSEDGADPEILSLLEQYQ